MVKVIGSELVGVKNQAVILVTSVLGVPHGMVVLGHVDLGVVEVPLAVARVGNTSRH